MSASSIAVRFFHEVAARAAESLPSDVQHPVRRHILTVALASYREEQAAMTPDDRAGLDPFFEQVQAALQAAK